MLFRMNYSVEWLGADGEWQVCRNPPSSPFGVRAVSRRHALNKMLSVVVKMPCFADREEFGPQVSLNATVSFAEEKTL